MTESKRLPSRSVYLAVRSTCRAAGIAMESADSVVAAFHAEQLHTIPDVAAAVKAEAYQAAKGSKDGKESKESKGEAKGDSKSEDSASSAALAVVDKIVKQLPKGAKSVPARSHDDEDGGDSGNEPLPPLQAIVRRVVVAAVEQEASESKEGSSQAAAPAVSRAVSSLDGSSSSAAYQRMPALTAYTRSLLEEGQFSDVTLVVEGKKIPAHKNLLTRSPYFAAMFSKQFSEAKQAAVEIKDVESQDFRKLLEFIYTDALPLSVVSPQHSMRLFVLADRFQLASLAEQCAQLFGETLDIDNVEECYLASLRPGHELLKQQCLDFIKDRYHEVVQATQGFARIAKTEPFALRDLILAKTPLVRGKRGGDHNALATSLSSCNACVHAFVPAAVPLLAFAPDHCQAGVALSGGNLRATRAAGGDVVMGYNSVYTSEEIKSGVHVWTVRFEVAANACVLGVAAQRGFPENFLCIGVGHVPGQQCFHARHQGPHAFDGGMVYDDGASAAYGAQFGRVGDLVATELDLDRRRVRWGLNGTWFAYRPLLRQQGSYWFGASLLPQCVIEVVPNPEWALSAVRR